jgi:transposase InsO family protein
MLGFDISERTELRWMRKAPKNPGLARGWATFPSNHRQAVAAMDSFSVPTFAFGVLYCFFVISHNRRRILRFNVARHPTTARVAQQRREAFPDDAAPRYLILDREHPFQGEVLETVKRMGISPVRTAVRSPWQNGIAERFVGNSRWDTLDHVIVLNERQLKRPMTEYICYYREDGIHLGLEKSTPAGREMLTNCAGHRKVISMSRVGSLHHRSNLAA